nr:hypothetical protein [Tanacetum cinerariifolium]
MVHDTQKTKGLLQSSSVSFDFTSKLLNVENISPADYEIASLMNTNVRHTKTSSQTSSLYTVPITAIPEVTTTIPPPPPFFNPLQHQSTYEVAASLLEFELIKILMDKMGENKSYFRVDYKKELYDVLFKSYNTNKDLFDTYDEVSSLKRGRDDKDKDQDPYAGSDRGTKRRKSSKEAESSKDSRSKERKSSSSSKDTSCSHHKSSGKSTHAEEPSHTVDDSEECQNQEFDTGNNDEQPDNEAAPRRDYDTARAEKPPALFDELMDTSFDFSSFVLNRPKILNLTQEILVGPAFNLLKGTCKSLTELEYHFEECSKAITERLDWHNLEGNSYPFDIHKPLLLILDHQGCQVIPRDYFINNDLEYLKGGSLSRKYSTLVTKIKAASYDIKWIQDMVPNLWSPIAVVYDKHAYSVTRLTIVKCYDYGYLDEIKVRREDQKLYTFKEGDFPRLRLQDIEDMLLLLVQQMLTNLTLEELPTEMELVPEQTQQGTSHEVSQKKEVIQYPRLTKLIIADIMSMFESIYKRLKEEYHAIKDVTPLVSVYTTRMVIVKEMLIPDNLITNVIRDTQEYKDYVEKYRGVDVPMIQPQPVKFTQGTHRTPRATRTPNPTDVVQKKSKGTPAVGETSSPMKSLKIRVRQQKLVFTIPPPPSNDQERYDIHETTLLSLALHKTAKNAEEQENIATIKEKQLEDDVEKIIEEDRAESHKENPKEIEDDEEENKDDKKDDDDNDDHDDHTLIKTQRTGNSKTRTDKVKTPIPSPLRSPRTNLSSDKDGWGGVTSVVQMMVEMVTVGVDVGGGEGDWRWMVAWCSVEMGQRW